MDVDSVSAGRRRRERRLRQFLRHERLSVAMALSEKKHHTSRDQRMERAGRWVRDALHGQPELFQLYEEEPGGSRPPCLGELLGSQVRSQRHTLEHLVDVCPFVQILDVPVPPQMENQLVEFMQRLDTLTPEQVIVVPKISQDRIPQRFVDRRRPQKAGQLVEVPTDPVPSCLFPFSSSRLPSRSLTFQFRVVVGVQAAEVFTVFSQNRIQQRRLPSRSFTFQFLVVAFAILSLIPVWQLHPQFRRISWSNGFFALFPDLKKVRSPLGGQVRGCTGTRAHWS